MGEGRKFRDEFTGYRTPEGSDGIHFIVCGGGSGRAA